MSPKLQKKLKKVETSESSESIQSDQKSQSSSIPVEIIKIDESKIDCDYNLEPEFKKLNCQDENFYSKDCNKFLLKKELVERKCLSETSEKDVFLYPNLNDQKFNIKIANKKEFNDTKYDGTIHENIKEYADILAKADFELQPHQAFVKNFLSPQTPYNSLLLYHGLGSGKTCSAIGVSEETRDYLKQLGINKRIIIVASENVQNNFRLNLFDERKLKMVDGLWNITGCIGNKLLKEINPMSMKGMSREKVISQIKKLINISYIFLGYGQFANYIINTINYNETSDKKGDRNNKQPSLPENFILNKKTIRRLRNEFDNRLIIIDEVHNIRMTDDNENKKVAINLQILVKAAENLKLLLLSATPMYNSYKEIVWLLNLMNINDRRGKIDVKDVFDKNGSITKDGEELLIRKATGYISFVRGENPYTFPYRVYPSEFDKKHTFHSIKYPEYQMNGKKIKDFKRIVSLYLNTIGGCKSCGDCQYCVYKYIINNLRNKSYSITTKKGIKREMPSFENMEAFGYTLLQTPLESLIISYPYDGLQSVIQKIPSVSYSEAIEEFIEPTKEDSEKHEIIKTAVEKETESSDEEEQEEESESESDEDSMPKLEAAPGKLVFNKTYGVIPREVEETWEINEKEKASKLKTKREIPPVRYGNKGGAKTSTNDSSSSSESLVEYRIDPHDLTGRKGLKRMMDFIDQKSPPEKGSFEYKSSTLAKYGKIFSQEVIGKYSSKIKCILDKIYNTDKNIVSDGIILIYSQYIDSGLIPMALALEEMGFTRYGENIKPLFKNKPNEVVDVKTMKPPSDKKAFMPARYTMITGDPRLSPNNDFELKGLTNEDNFDGKRVKVVLISKAGSEGIDFKYIRQVHILEPWYNMNRIEQIIGRAVRNFSHKDLDFEERNVQIFMYGTILEDNKEEASDLYVYRVAEFKAKQIGHVSRILKETAVDCIINHGQTEFTQKIMQKKIEGNIKQKLSTGLEITNFKVGDAPYSAACDYMKKCEYKCRPNEKIKINKDTYSENFITINSEKIMQRIRMLMRESFFYKKSVFIKLIRTPKEYPYVQIYSALTQLIEDNSEIITDKYGRTGHLVNIGEYYLFQPSELRDKNISIFDRSVPIDYKHSMINFELKPDVLKQSSIPKIRSSKPNPKIIVTEKEKDLHLDIRPNINEEVEMRPDISEIPDIITEIKANYNLALEYLKIGKVKRAEDNWYQHCGIVMKNLKENYYDIDVIRKLSETKKNDIQKYLLIMLVEHIIELLTFNDKVIVLNYLYSMESIPKDSFEWFAKEYFDRNTIFTKDLTAIIFYNFNKRQIMILNSNNKWIPAEPEDERELASSKETKTFLAMDANDLNKNIGFIGYEKKNTYLIFKTKDMLVKRNTGARCDESGKIKTLELLNSLIDQERFTKESTKKQKDVDGKIIIREAIGQTELCVLQEFILRYFNKVKRENKIWFLTPEMALYHKV